VERIKSLTDDLALALAAPSIRIEAPVPGKPLVGIEVPNSVKGTVTLRGILESIPFRKVQARSRLAIALGRAAGGEAVVTDLSRMPHLLIAGATGSGKTVCLNCIITSLLMFNTPDELQLILVDPKRVELVSFNSIPHLAYPVIVEQDKAVEMLNWLNQEMDSRYRRMAIVGARNIEAYNHSARVDKPLPYVVVVIDELADLMMSRPEQVEPAICRLAQLARATGIHLVVATQRPSVDVITGLIKANFPSRISFAVTSQVDSRTILDVAGAERLLGRGDMLFLPPDASKPRRLQGCFISDAEIDRVVRFWAKQRLPLEEAAMAFTPPPSRGEGSAPDPLLEEARQLAKEHRQLSVSFLQRRLRIGYPRAVQLMEQLQAEEAPQAARAEPEENKS
jgi:S-DNA-T family DNA segregation ATPase FtsK/SpoIIIE